MGKILLNCLKFGPAAQEIRLKIFLYLALAATCVKTSWKKFRELLSSHIPPLLLQDPWPCVK